MIAVCGYDSATTGIKLDSTKASAGLVCVPLLVLSAGVLLYCKIAIPVKYGRRMKPIFTLIINPKPQ